MTRWTPYSLCGGHELHDHKGTPRQVRAAREAIAFPDNDLAAPPAHNQWPMWAER